MKKLILNRETVRKLGDTNLQGIQGGRSGDSCDTMCMLHSWCKNLCDPKTETV